MALTQISTQGIKDGTITGSDLATNVDLVDNQKLRLGNSQDLQIYHDASHSRIVDSGTGGLKIQSNALAIDNVAGTETMAAFTEDGSVQLRFNNSTMLETTASGVTVSGLLSSTKLISSQSAGSAGLGFLDNVRINLGTSDDFVIYHDGTDNLLSTVGTVLAVHRGTTNAGNPVFEVRSNHGATNQIKFQVDGDGDVLIPTDTGKLQLGVSQDLQLYHDGTDSIITNSTGDLQITDTSDDITITAADDIRLRPQGGENGINVLGDGAIELYHNNEKVFETEADGVKVSDDNESVHVRLVSSAGDAGFLYGASNNNIGLLTSSGNYAIRGIEGGATELYHNNVLKLTTLSAGVQMANGSGNNTLSIYDNDKLSFGNAGDLKIYHDGSNSFIQDSGTGNLIIQATDFRVSGNSTSENIIKGNENGAVELYYNNGKKFETLTNGVRVTGQVDVNGGGIHLEDSRSLLFGASDDLQIFHDGSNSYIKDAGTGSLLIRGSTVSIQSVSGEAMIEGVADGAVTIKHDNSTKLQTTSSGVDVTGALTVNGAAIGGGGKVIQVLRTTASMSSTSSGSFQSTGLSQAITMTNSANKVLAIATGGFNNASAGAGGGASIFRGTANLAHSNDLMASYFGEDDSNNIEYTATFQGLDTPGAGTHTYTVQLRAFSGTMRFGYRNTGVLTLIELDYS